MDQLKRIIPFGSICIVIVSFFNLYFYYSGLGIPIQHYLEVSEIVFSLTSLTSVGVLILFISLPLILIAKPDSSSMIEAPATFRKRNENMLSKFFKDNKYQIIRKVYAKITTTIVLLISTGFLAFYYVYEAVSETTIDKITKSSFDFDVNSVIAITCGAAFLALINRVLHPANNIGNGDIVRLAYCLSFLFLVYLGARNAISADLIKTGHPKYSIKLVCNDKLYSSNDSILYAGATKGYYFLRNTKSNENIIIPIKEVKEATIVKLRGGL